MRGLGRVAEGGRSVGFIHQRDNALVGALKAFFTQ